MATDMFLTPASFLINKCVMKGLIKEMWPDKANPISQLPKELGVNVPQRWV